MKIGDMIVDDKFLNRNKWKKVDDKVWVKKGLMYNTDTFIMQDSLDWCVKVIDGKQTEFIANETRYRNWPNV